MKKWIKITIIAVVLIIVLLVGYGIYKAINGPIVPFKDKKEITDYVEKYLTKKYGDHKFKVTSVEYEYDMAYIFDYSNPKGYWVYFKSDVVPRSWVIIDGIIPNDYKIDHDYLIQKYYFPDKDGYDTVQEMDDLIPAYELEDTVYEDLKNEFDSNVYGLYCDGISLVIPDDYGKIPTLEELKTNTSLYKVYRFNFRTSTEIEDKEGYETRLKEYIKKKFNRDSKIYFYKNNSIEVTMD